MVVLDGTWHWLGLQVAEGALEFDSCSRSPTNSFSRRSDPWGSAFGSVCRNGEKHFVAAKENCCVLFCKAFHLFCIYLSSEMSPFTEILK